MTASIKVDIDIEAAQFVAFYAKFREYQAAQAKLPDNWKKVAESADASRKSTAATVEATVIGADAMARAASHATVLRHASEKTAEVWSKLSRSTISVAGNIASATASLLKWSGIVGVVGGLAGAAGGFFGMDALGKNVSAERTAAMGLSTGYGSRRSFLLNYDRLGDANSILGRVNELQHSAEGQAPLSMMGLTGREGDSAEVSFLYLDALRKKARALKSDSYLEDFMRGNRSSEVVDLQTVQRLRNTGDKEWAGMRKRSLEDRARFGLTPDQQAAWQRFTTTLKNAGTSIETVFVRNLAKLTPGMTAISDGILHLVDVLLPDSKDGGPLAHWLDSLNKLLEEFAGWLKTGGKSALVDFAEAVKNIAEKVWAFAKGAWGLAKQFGFVTEAQAEAYAGSPGGGGGGGSALGGDSGGGGKGAESHAPEGSLTRLIHDAAQKAASRYGADPTDIERKMNGIRAGESAHSNRYDVKDDALESSWGPFQLNRRRGMGVQFERDTHNDLRDPKTIEKQAEWVADYLARGGSTRPWMGYHGPRSADARWGNSGYTPNAKIKVSVNPSPSGSLFNQFGATAFSGAH